MGNLGLVLVTHPPKEKSVSQNKPSSLFPKGHRRKTKTENKNCKTGQHREKGERLQVSLGDDIRGQVSRKVLIGNNYETRQTNSLVWAIYLWKAPWTAAYSRTPEAVSL